MKRIILLILVIMLSMSLLTFSFVGCKSEDDITSEETEKTEETTAEEVEEVAEETVEEETVEEEIPGIDRPIRILWVSYGMSLVGQQEMQAGAIIEREGISFEVIAEDPELNLEKEINILETYLTQDIDIALVSVFSPEALVPIFERYKERGIWVGTTGGVAPNQDFGFITDEYNSGLLCGEKLEEWWPENRPGEDVKALMAGFPTSPNVQAKIDGFVDYVEQNNLDWVEITSSIDAKGTVEGGLETTTPVFSSHPEINFVWGANDGCVLGAWQAAKNLGLDDNLALVGMGGETSAIAQLEKPLNENNAGWIYEVSYGKSWPQYGYDCISTCIYIVQNNTTEGAPPIDIGHKVIDRDNLPEWLDAMKDWREKAGLEPLTFDE